MKLPNKAILIFILIIILFILLFNLLWFKDGKECLEEPLTYGAKEYSKSNNAYFYCNCHFNAPNTPSIFVDGNGYKLIEN